MVVHGRDRLWSSLRSRARYGEHDVRLPIKLTSGGRHRCGVDVRGPAYWRITKVARLNGRWSWGLCNLPTYVLSYKHELEYIMGGMAREGFLTEPQSRRTLSTT